MSESEGLILFHTKKEKEKAWYMYGIVEHPSITQKSISFLLQKY
jgi:hypothetical protein